MLDRTAGVPAPQLCGTKPVLIENNASSYFRLIVILEGDEAGMLLPAGFDPACEPLWTGSRTIVGQEG